MNAKKPHQSGHVPDSLPVHGRRGTDLPDGADRVFLAVLGAGVYLLYELTGAPGFYWGDGGEFIAAARTLGIGHPYGHPLFWLAGRVGMVLAPGDPAAAMTRLVSFCAALGAAAAGYWIMRRQAGGTVRQNRWITAGFVMLLYATAPTVWSQATYVEVYHVQALMMILALLCLDEYAARSGSVRMLMLSAYFWGLAVTLGMYALLLALLPLLMILMDGSFRRRLSWRLLIIFLPAFIAGLTPWIYLPLRSGVNPPLLVFSLKDISSCMNYLARSGYHSQMETAGTMAVVLSLKKAAMILLRDLRWPGCLVAGAGIWRAVRHRRQSLIYLLSGGFLLLLFALSLPFQLSMEQLDEMDVYLIPVLLILLPVTGEGTGFFLEKISRFRFRALLFFLPLAAVIGWSWRAMDRSGDRTAVLFYNMFVRTIPDRAVLYCRSDETKYTVYYAMYGRGNPNHLGLLDLNEGPADPDSLILHPRMFLEGSLALFRSLDSIGATVMAGPFVTSLRNRPAAASIQKYMADHFQYGELGKPVRMSRFRLARIWSGMGMSWFQRYLRLDGQAREEAFRQACFCFEQACHMDDFSYSAGLHAANFAQILASEGHRRDARQWADRAVKHNPLLVEPRLLLYRMAMQERRYRDAFLHLRKLVRLVPDNGTVCMDLALLYSMMNDQEASRKWYLEGRRLGEAPRVDLEKKLFQGENTPDS